MPIAPIVFFDGYCVLCNGFVDFLLKVDRKEELHFASLQGLSAQKLLGPTEQEPPFIVYLDERGQSTRSTAVLRILARLGGVYRLTGIFYVLPRLIRDGIYNFIAKRRHRWFGKRSACRMPLPHERARLLE